MYSAVHTATGTAIMATVLALSACGQVNLPNGVKFPSDSLTEFDRGLLSYDKGQHFIAGIGIATVTNLALENFTTMERMERKAYGCAAAATIGVAKEVYDKHIQGTRFEAADAVYTAAGCLFSFEWVF